MKTWIKNFEEAEKEYLPSPNTIFNDKKSVEEKFTQSEDELSHISNVSFDEIEETSNENELEKIQERENSAVLTFPHPDEGSIDAVHEEPSEEELLLETIELPCYENPYEFVSFGKDEENLLKKAILNAIRLRRKKEREERKRRNFVPLSFLESPKRKRKPPNRFVPT